MKKVIFTILILTFVLTLSFFSNTSEATSSLMENTVKVNIPRFENWDNNPVLIEINKNLYDKAYLNFKSWLDPADEGDVQPTPERFDIAEYHSDYALSYCKNDIYSFVFVEYVYPFRAAHGSSLMVGYTFNIKDAKEYQLKDFFKEGSNWKEYINDYIKKEIKEKEIPIFDVTPFESINENQEFYIGSDSLVIFFQQYAYTAYAYGFLKFEISYESLKDYLKLDL